MLIFWAVKISVFWPNQKETAEKKGIKNSEFSFVRNFSNMDRIQENADPQKSTFTILHNLHNPDSVLVFSVELFREKL